MKTKILIISFFFLSLMITANIFGQNYGSKNVQKYRLQYKEQISNKLNLTDDQLARIGDLKLTHRKQMIDLRADLEKKEVELQELKNTLNYSREAYLNKISEIIASKDKIALARANHQMDVYQILDEAQKKEWNRMTQNMHWMKNNIERRMRLQSSE